MEFRISFLYQWDPELIRVGAVSIQGCFRLCVIRNTCVNDHVLPATVFEKLEYSESVFKAIIDNQILKEVPVRGKDQEGTEKPAVAQDTLFDITWGHTVLDKHSFLRGYFMWAFPFDLRGVLCILRGVCNVLV